MNKKILISLFILLSFFELYSQGNIKLWEALYQDAVTIRQKKDLLENINKTATKDFEPLILIILQDIYEFPRTNMALEQHYFEEAVFYLALMINNLKLKRANPEKLKLMYKRLDNPKYRGEVLNAIGTVGDPNILPWLNSELKRLNRQHKTGEFGKQEDALYGLIKGLAQFNDESSFKDLFYAAIPNYHDTITELALETIQKITDDPAPLCQEIMEDSLDYKMMLEAVRYAVASKSPNEHKISICKSALYRTMDEVEAKEDGEAVAFQHQLRDEAAKFLGELKPKDEESIELLDRKWEYDVGVHSRLATVEALQSIATDGSAQALASRLSYLIEMKMQGAKTGYLEDDGRKTFIAVINALGDIGSTVGLKELYQLSVSPRFESDIRQAASDALERMSGK